MKPTETIPGPIPGSEHPVDHMLRTGRYREAAWVVEHYLDDFPDDPGCYANLAICYGMQSRFVEAVALYAKAVSLDPNNPALVLRLGRGALAIGELDQAAENLRHAIKLTPADPEPYGLLGLTMRAMRKFDGAIDAYRSFAKTNGAPDVNLDSSLVFTADMDERTSLTDRMQVRADWYATHKAPWKFHAWPNVKWPDRKLTIGYVSGDFRTHSAAYAFAPLILDRDAYNYRVVCFFTETHGDSLTELFKENADAWHAAAGISDDELAHLIRQEKIDILVDLSGHTPANRLRVFTTKPAPVAVTMIGFIGTSGIPDIDYSMIDDGYVTREEQGHFVEEPWLLSSATQFKIQEYIPKPAPSPCIANGYVTFGCMQHFSKVTDVALQTWAAIVTAVPGSKLMIKDDVVTSDSGRERLRKYLDLPAERVILAHSTPHPEHMEDHGKIDIALDCWPQSGGVTTLEAITMGVPVVTLVGDRPYQRGGASIGRHLPEDVIQTHDIAAYIAAAIKLANDPAQLGIQRAQRRARLIASPVGNTASWVKEVETAYREMWRRWCNDY